MGFIFNASDRPLSALSGNLPNVGGAMSGLFQPMVFGLTIKTVKGYQVSETSSQLAFRGVMQPLSKRDLAQKPEGQRAWTWLLLHAEPSVALEVDSVVIYQGVQTRVMAKTDYAVYGYVQYELVQDWTGAGP